MKNFKKENTSIKTLVINSLRARLEQCGHAEQLEMVDIVKQERNKSAFVLKNYRED